MSPPGHDKGAKPSFSFIPEGASSCVVVFHEVWGLVQHTRDVCKRIGKLGFASVAPDLYKGHGDVLTPTNIQAAMEAVWNLSLEERRNRDRVERELARKDVAPRTRQVVAVLYDQAFRDGLLSSAVGAVEQAQSKFEKVATLGFCLGGGLSLNVAARTRHLSSAIAFYGEPPQTEDVLKISVPMMTVFAHKDEIINQRVPAFVETALRDGKDLTLKVFPGTKHGFFNDTRKAVYNRKAASEAWELTKWFLTRTLG